RVCWIRLKVENEFLNSMYIKQLSLILWSCLIGNTVMGQLNEKPFVIPSLQQWEGRSGDFSPGENRRIIYTASNKDAQKAAGMLRDDLAISEQGAFKVLSAKPKKGDIVFTILPGYDSILGDEGYYFDVADVLTISANTYKGLFWGSRSLLQLFEQNAGRRVPKGLATDYPQYPVRGFMLDVGRKFFTMEFLERYVKLMSYYKMSDFQIHLNDNGFKQYFGNNWDSTYSGFRLESETYPNLPTKGEFYTKKEFRKLQQMASDYGVN